MITTAQDAGSPAPASDLPADLPTDQIEAEICTLAGQIAAATSRFLRLLAVFDQREGWAGWNVRSCAHWLSWRCGLDMRTAHEHLRVARSLAELPRIHEAFDAGQLSYSKVRAITRVATPVSEPDLLEAALHAPAAHVERLVRGLRRATDQEADPASSGVAPRPRERGPRVNWRWDDDTGDLVIHGRLAAVDGARLLAAITRAQAELDRAERSAEQSADQEERDPATVIRARPPSDLNPGLVAMADMVCAGLPAPRHAPAAEVVVSVGIDTFLAAIGEPSDADLAAPEETVQPARLDNGSSLTAATLRRLADDARLCLALIDGDGRTLDLGRARRSPNSAQLTILWRRDRGCSVPGCDRSRFLHAHHVVFWSSGGSTSLDNLTLLCGTHHRALHEGAFAITPLGAQRFRFSGPGGDEYVSSPATTGSVTDLAAARPDIEPATIEPDWDGTPLHRDAIGWYLTAWQQKIRRNSRTPRWTA